MPASAKDHLDAMEKAIKDDFETAQHNAAKEKMKQTEREIELLNMATRMADRQMAFNMRQADYIGNIGYACVRCKQHPHDCTCNSPYYF